MPDERLPLFHRMLERFEKQHGSYYDILAQYPPPLLYHYPPQENVAETRRLQGLLRAHDSLCRMVTAYNIGYEAGKKEAANKQ